MLLVCKFKWIIWSSRENICHTKCYLNKVGSMIIWGSCTNVASITLIHKLGLSMLYNLDPISYGDRMISVKVDKQVLLCLTWGRYSDKVMYDVIPMHHGISYWEGQDNMIGSDTWCFKNRYNFVKERKSVTLVHLTPKQVNKDKLKLKVRQKERERKMRVKLKIQQEMRVKLKLQGKKKREL